MRKPLLWLMPGGLRRLLRARPGPSVKLLLDQHLSHSAFLDGRHIPAHPDSDLYMEPWVETRADPSSPDGLPIPPKELCWDYAETAERYLEIGKQNVERMRSILRDHGVTSGREIGSSTSAVPRARRPGACWSSPGPERCGGLTPRVRT